MTRSLRPRPFYAAFGVVVVAGCALVLVPGAPLITILVLTQVLNAILLLPLLVFMYGMARDRALMGGVRRWTAGRRGVSGDDRAHRRVRHRLDPAGLSSSIDRLA